MRVLMLALLLPCPGMSSPPPPSAKAQDAAPADLHSLSWLEGRWTGQDDGVDMEEHWTSPSGGGLLGMHKDVKDGRMVSFEFLRIEATLKEGVVYFASPRSATPTPFRMMEAGAARVVFENKEHDFPQRILYWLGPKGELHARVEGTSGGKAVYEEWVWTKAR
jgi:hypothetical protein